MSKSVVFAVNPNSGDGNRGRIIEECVQAVSAKGFSVRVESSIDVICEIVAEQLKNGVLQGVVSVGGDGTLALLANRLPDGAPLCVLPLGTENLVARSLGFQKSASALADVVSNGKETRFDVGVANGRSFLAMLGAGFDAEVVTRLHTERRGHISYFSYLLPILRVACSYKYPEIKVSYWADGNPTPHVCTARWVFVANLARYALGLDICPDAKADDGLLHGCFLSHSGLLPGLRYLWQIRSGTHVLDPSVTMAEGIRFRLESDQPVAYQLDGDPGGVLPVDIKVLPRRLRLLVPAAARRRQ